MNEGRESGALADEVMSYVEAQDNVPSHLHRGALRTPCPGVQGLPFAFPNLRWERVGGRRTMRQCSQWSWWRYYWPCIGWRLCGQIEWLYAQILVHPSQSTADWGGVWVKFL